MTAIDFNGQVAIVTGAGGGLGREHALALAKRGAKVVVNDLGGAVDGTGGSSSAAQKVVDEIKALGGEAMANHASVTDFAAVQAMVDEVMAKWGRVDVLINNAGILRDKSFVKMELDNFRSVLEVHLMGSVHTTKAVWPIMREQKYGRIMMTTSSSGLYGSFGQTNYASAKMGLVGLMKSLALEGEKYGIHVNCLSPSAATRMTNGLYEEDLLKEIEATDVVPAMLVLASRQAPQGSILCAGAGSFEAAFVTLTKGVYLGKGSDTPERLLERLEQVFDPTDEMMPRSGPEQSQYEGQVAQAAHENLN